MSALDKCGIHGIWDNMDWFVAFVSTLAISWVDTRPVEMLISASMLSTINNQDHLNFWDSPPACTHHYTSPMLWIVWSTEPHHMSNWQGSHASASRTSFCDSKHQVQLQSELSVYLQDWLWYYQSEEKVGSHMTRQVSPEAGPCLTNVAWCCCKFFSLKAVLPLAERLATASDRCNKTGPCCWVLYTDSSASRLDIIVTMNMFSGDSVEKRFEIIIFALIFILIQRDFCVINDNNKGLETRCW